MINVRRQNRAGKGTARTKTRAGRRQVPIEPTLRPLLEALIENGEEGKPLLRVPPPEDCAELVRRDLIAAGCDREELFADDAERQHFFFHSLRHTCLTHWAVAGRPLAWLLSAAGHTSPEMTQRYTDAGMVIRASFGQPHPPMPAELLEEVSEGFGVWTPKPNRNFPLSHGNMVIPTGIEGAAGKRSDPENLAPFAIGSEGVPPETARAETPSRPLASTPLPPASQNAEPTAAELGALYLAAVRAERWEDADELRRMRREHRERAAGNVVALDARRRDGR